MNEEKGRIEEGLVKKGGLNERPSSPRPAKNPAPLKPHREYEGAKAIAGPQRPDCAVCGIATKIGSTCGEKCADVLNLINMEPIEDVARDFSEQMAERAELSRRVTQYLLGENRRLKEALRTKAPVNPVPPSQDEGNPHAEKLEVTDGELESIEDSLGEFSIDRISEDIEVQTSGCAGAEVGVRTDRVRWMVWATRQCAKLLPILNREREARKGAEAMLEHNKCHNGHETLPLKLWDCPAYHDETKDRLSAIEKAWNLLQKEMSWLRSASPARPICASHATIELHKKNNYWDAWIAVDKAWDAMVAVFVKSETKKKSEEPNAD